MHIKETEIPPHSLIAKSFPRFDFKDAYEVQFHTANKIAAENLMDIYFKVIPWWVRFLFWLRNKLVTPFGLISKYKVNRDLFKPFGKTPNELLVGGNDKHLDFRLSFFLEKKAHTEYTFILSTVVLMHNLLGRTYFFLIKPFHKVIAKNLMKAIIRSIEK